MIRYATALAVAAGLAASANGAPASSTPTARDASSGMASGKVSMQDLHFSSQADAVSHCDKAPVTKAPDGSFTCSVPADSAAAKTATYDLKKATK